MTVHALRNKFTIVAASAFCGALSSYGWIAAAEGAPTTQPLFYGGVVASKQGEPLDGKHTVAVSIFDGETGGDPLCATSSLSAAFTEGHFRVALPSGNNGCAQAVAANADTYVELTVDGTTFPRSKIGAMPYAIESEHAKVATTASSVTGAQAQALTSLSADVTALQAKVAAIPAAATPAVPAAVALKARFIGDGNGCTYGSAINSTVCSCNPGEIITSAGGWAGPNAAINASRAQHGPDDTLASDSDRAREWTISCITLAGGPVQCQRVQAVCLSI